MSELQKQMIKHMLFLSIYEIETLVLKIMTQLNISVIWGLGFGGMLFCSVRQNGGQGTVSRDRHHQGLRFKCCSTLTYTKLFLLLLKGPATFIGDKL